MIKIMQKRITGVDETPVILLGSLGSHLIIV